MSRCSFFLLLPVLIVSSGCENAPQKRTVASRQLKDVQAQHLGYRFEADSEAPQAATQEPKANLPLIQSEFDARRKDEALVRTISSPDGQRVLALYETGEDNQGSFRVDMYASDGKFLRNLLPPELSGAFPDMAAWSPDGSQITFIARKSQKAGQPPDPLQGLPPEDVTTSPSPSASVAPIFAPVPSFNTEQIYICNRDGFDLKPLTVRDGLIYFTAAWAPDGQAIASLACKEDEWDSREKLFMLPVGRPRLISLDGRERLLDDELTEADPVWSPDSSKVATAFETYDSAGRVQDVDVAIYDASTAVTSGARIPLREPLIKASLEFDEKTVKKKSTKKEEKVAAPAAPATLPASYNPIVRLEWSTDETLFLQTAYVRTLPNDPVRNFPRWHKLTLATPSAEISSVFSPLAFKLVCKSVRAFPQSRG